MVEGLENVDIERVSSTSNMNIAIAADTGAIYTWGDFPKGLALKPCSYQCPLPERSQELEGQGFRDIAFTKDSAVGIARSIKLLVKFKMPDSILGKTEEQIIDVHAIPVYDGTLIRCEADLAAILYKLKDLKVGLLNDFDV